MPVASELLNHDTVASRALVESRAGIILHEVGHYVASNADGLIRGQLIIEDRDDANCSGAFAMDNFSQRRLQASVARCSFVSAAGAITEQQFFGCKCIRRLGSDIDAYRSLPTIDPNMPAQDVVAKWHMDYFPLNAALASCIRANFDRCIAYCASNKLLLGAHHVIPTCLLKSPRRRGISERLDEVVWTLPRKERIQALERYLAERGDSNLGGRIWRIHFHDP